MRATAGWSIAIALILAIAAGLRFVRLGWGLADGICFQDEEAWLESLRAFATITLASFDPPNLTYPTLYRYLSGLAARGAAELGLVSPLGTSYSLAPLLVARAVSAAAGVATVGVVAALGRAMLGARAGLAAAAFMAVAPLAVMQPYYASVDSVLVLCVALTLLASWRVMIRGSVAAALQAGAAVGLTIAAKYTGLAFVTAVAWAVAERAWAERSLAVLVRLGAAVTLGVFAGVLFGCPPCVLRPDRVYEAILMHRSWTVLATFDGNCIAPSIGWWSGRWLHQGFAVLPYALGLPLWVLAFVGLLAAVRHRTAADRLLLGAMVPYFVYMGSSAVAFPRYMLPLAPGLTVLAARGLCAARAPIRVRSALGAVVVAYGLALSGSQVLQRFSWDQQRTVATWLDAHVARTADHRVVVIPQYLYYFRMARPLTQVGFRVEQRPPGTWFDGATPVFVLPDWYATAIRRDRRHPQLLDDLERLESGAAGLRPVFRLPAPPYLQQGIDVRLDPAFAVDLWQGTLGFTVYARDGVVQP